MKGISPFIATVLILSLTIGVGVLVGPWAYNLFKSQTSTVAQESETAIECKYGGIRIDDSSVKCLLSGSSDMLNFTLENTGSVDLYNFTCEIYLNGFVYEYGVNNSINNQTFTASTALKPAQKRTVAVNITDNLAAVNPEWIRIRIPRCPTVDDKVTGITCS